MFAALRPVLPWRKRPDAGGSCRQSKVMSPCRPENDAGCLAGTLPPRHRQGYLTDLTAWPTSHAVLLNGVSAPKWTSAA